MQKPTLQLLSYTEANGNMVQLTRNRSAVCSRVSATTMFPAADGCSI